MRRLALIFLAGCSTLAEAGGGNDNLPNAGAGPFREIKNEELGQGRAAPYAFRDDDDFQRDAAYLDADGDIATLETWAYVARTAFGEGVDPDPSAPSNEIVRHIALDGRSYARQFEVVLTPQADWEGDTVARPAVVRSGRTVFLYYAGAGGIGVATSSDGVAFARAGANPILTEGTSPSVIVLPDGRFRMYYAVRNEAEIRVVESEDGVTWSESGAQPSLAPRAGELDEGGVSAPFAILGQSAEGRDIEFLYYGAIAADDQRTIAMVARYGTSGPWSYATAPVFGGTGSLAPTEPVVVPFDGFKLLFVTQKAGSTEALDYPAIAVGVAPADAVLPPPDPP